MPTPISTRPPLMLSSTARSSASRTGWLNGSRQTSQEKRTFLVRAAIAAATGNPRRQVAVVDEVMLGEPDEVEAEPVEPRDLVHDRGIELLMGEARLRRIAEVVGDAEAERFAGGHFS